MKQYRYDANYDALCISLGKSKVARTEMLSPDELRQVDYDISGRPLGVEFFAVKKGIDLAGLPETQLLSGLSR